MWNSWEEAVERYEENFSVNYTKLERGHWNREDNDRVDRVVTVE